MSITKKDGAPASSGLRNHGNSITAGLNGRVQQIQPASMQPYAIPCKIIKELYQTLSPYTYSQQYYCYFREKWKED